jgi:hypothetical protein
MCVICRTNYARPSSYVTCENLSCFRAYKKFLWQHRNYGADPYTSLKEVEAQIHNTSLLIKKRDAIKRYIKVLNVFKKTHRTVDNSGR